MADADQIAALRVMVNEPDQSNYNDDALGVIIDAADGDVEKAASEIWQQKAARFSTLVNVSESGSSRNMGDLYKNALAMAKYYADKSKPIVTPPESDRPRTRNISRA